jgi:hypothetical protein
MGEVTIRGVTPPCYLRYARGMSASTAAATAGTGMRRCRRGCATRGSPHGGRGAERRTGRSPEHGRARAQARSDVKRPP